MTAHHRLVDAGGRSAPVEQRTKWGYSMKIRRTRALLIAVTSAAAGIVAAAPNSASAWPVCPSGTVRTAATSGRAGEAAWILFYREKEQLQVFIRTGPATACALGMKAGSGASAPNGRARTDWVAKVDPIPYGQYRIGAFDEAGTEIKGWRAPLTMFEKANGTAVSMTTGAAQSNGKNTRGSFVTRTALYLHSEMPATGDFTKAYVVGQVPPPVTLPNGSVLSFIGQTKSSGDSSALWGDADDYRSLGCIKVAPADLAVLHNLASMWPRVATGVRLQVL
ncbi:MAG: hypothetical protein ACK5CE_16920 [Actinomycetes bacterium]|nr:hypothetical protein [Actinomycetota bacterium]